MASHAEDNSICCPRFDPAPWENKHFRWEDKLFIQDRVRSLFYMPVNFGHVMRKLDGKLKQAGASAVDNMGLSDHTSRWNMDIYIAVDREVAGAKNVKLTGNFFSRVYEGPFRNTGKWLKDCESEAEKLGMTIKKMYMWYTTCPKCAKKYGKNYVVIVGEV
jgi:hypothetical protein